MTRLFYFLGAVVLFLLRHTNLVPHASAPVLAVVLMWLLPGTALLRLLGREVEGAAPRLAWAFGLSAAWLSASSLLLWLLHLDPLRLPDITSVMLAYVALVRVKPPGQRPETMVPVGVMAGQLVILGVAMWLGWLRGGAIGQSHDSLDHLSYMKTILTDHQVLPLREYYADVTSRVLDLRKGLLHAPLAVTAHLSQESLAAFWHTWPIFVGPAITACVYVLARSILGSESAALCTMGLFVLFYGGPGHTFLLKAGYPNKTAEALAWLGLASAIPALRGAEREEPVPAPWMFAAASLVHVFAAPPYLFVWGIYLAVAVFVRRLRPGALMSARGFGAVILACLPVLAWRLASSYHPVNAMHTGVEGMLNLPQGFILNPATWLASLGNAAWLALPLSAWLYLKRRDPESGLLVAAVWGPALLLFNPWLMPVVAPRLGYLVVRLFPPILALCAVAGWLTLRTGGRRGWLRIAALVGVIALLGLDARSTLMGYGAAAQAVEDAHSPRPWQAALTFLDRVDPERTVVAADPITSYGISGLTHHDVIATLNQHSSPSDSEAAVRMQAALDILSPACPPARTAELLRRYDVDYVVLNHSYPYATLDYMAAIDPGAYPGQTAKFEGQPGVFRRCWEQHSVTIYQVLPQGLEDYAELPAPQWPDEPWAAPAITDLGLGTELLTLAASPDSVPAGDTLEVSSLMRRVARPRPGTRLMAEWSLDGVTPRPVRFLPQRLARALAQRRDHRLYRLNYYTSLSSPHGLPEYWPEGKAVACRSPLWIPTGAAPGRYALRMRVVRQQFQPSYDLRWHLEDDNATPGGVLDSVTIGPPKAKEKLHGGE